MNGSEVEWVIVPMDEYRLMTMDSDDVRLIAVADERMSHFDMSSEEFYKKFGITQEMIDAMPEVELELSGSYAFSQRSKRISANLTEARNSESRRQ